MIAIEPIESTKKHEHKLDRDHKQSARHNPFHRREVARDK